MSNISSIPSSSNSATDESNHHKLSKLRSSGVYSSVINLFQSSLGGNSKKVSNSPSIPVTSLKLFSPDEQFRYLMIKEKCIAKYSPKQPVKLDFLASCYSQTLFLSVLLDDRLDENKNSPYKRNTNDYFLEINEINEISWNNYPDNNRSQKELEKIKNGYYFIISCLERSFNKSKGRLSIWKPKKTISCTVEGESETKVKLIAIPLTQLFDIIFSSVYHKTILNLFPSLIRPHLCRIASLYYGLPAERIEKTYYFYKEIKQQLGVVCQWVEEQQRRVFEDEKLLSIEESEPSIGQDANDKGDGLGLMPESFCLLKKTPPSQLKLESSTAIREMSSKLCYNFDVSEDVLKKILQETYRSPKAIHVADTRNILDGARLVQSHRRQAKACLKLIKGFLDNPEEMLKSKVKDAETIQDPVAVVQQCLHEIMRWTTEREFVLIALRELLQRAIDISEKKFSLGNEKNCLEDSLQAPLLLHELMKLKVLDPIQHRNRWVDLIRKIVIRCLNCDESKTLRLTESREKE